MRCVYQGILAAALGAAVLTIGSFDVATAGGGMARSGGVGHGGARTFIGGHRGHHAHVFRRGGHGHGRVFRHRQFHGLVAGVPLYGYSDVPDTAPLAVPEYEPAIDPPVQSVRTETSCKHSVETVKVPIGDGSGRMTEVTIWRC